MEAQTPFNLSEALAAWRRELAAQLGVTADHVRELETHLTDAIADLQRRGLHEEEAFRSACQQFGPLDKIADELVKANPTAFWRERVFWMVTGVVGIHLFYGAFVGLGLSSLPSWFHLAGFDFDWRWWNPTMFWVTPFCLAWLALRVADGKLPKHAGTFLEMVGSPRRCGWILITILVCFSGYNMLNMWRFSKLHPIPESIFPWWSQACSQAASTAVTALLLFLLMRCRATALDAWRHRILWMAIGVLIDYLWRDGTRAAMDGLAFLLIPRGAVAEQWFIYSWFPLASGGLTGIALLIAFHGVPRSLRRRFQPLSEPRRLAGVLLVVLVCLVWATSWSNLYRFQVLFGGFLQPGFLPPVRFDAWSSAVSTALLNAIAPALAAFLIVRLVSRQMAERERGETYRPADE